MNRSRTLGAPIVRLGRVTSTMDIARRLNQLGAVEGTTVIAAAQSLGRGRADRVWQSPVGSGLYCSILLRPELAMEQFRPFSVAAGLALCDALDPNHDLGLRLKWPNDILYQDRKLAGILTTTSLMGPKISSAILGIGLNLQPDVSQPQTAMSLAEIDGISRAALERPESLIVSSLSNRYSALCANDSAAALAGWPVRLAYLYQSVTLQDGSSLVSGTIEGLDPTGALMLTTEIGPQVIVSGELSRGPRLA